MADRSMFDRLHKALEVVRSHICNNIQKGKKKPWRQKKKKKSHKVCDKVLRL